MDREVTRQARAALRTEEIAELLASSREPLTRERFWENVKYSLNEGRTLQLDEDPSVYLDEDTLEKIENGEDPGLTGTRVVWPVD